jgi:hypothetical protein
MVHAYIKSMKTTALKQVVENIEDMTAAGKFANAKFVGDLECRNRADKSFIPLIVVDECFGQSTEFFVRAELPKQRMRIEEKIHLPLSPGKEYFPSHASSSSSDIGSRNTEVGS